MSNWFERNQTKSVILYTITVAGVTWVCLNFIIDENRVNLYRAQKESADAENKTLEAKVSIYQEENARVRADRDRYLSWLQSDPKSIPYADKEIANLSSEVSMLKTKIGALKTAGLSDGHKNAEVAALGPYVNSQAIQKGSAFFDPKTDVRLGINMVHADYTVDGTAYIPGRGSIDIADVRPGKTFEFQKDGKPYTLTVDEVNFLTDSAKISVQESGK
jgi:hypothetical protein